MLLVKLGVGSGVGGMTTVEEALGDGIVGGSVGVSVATGVLGLGREVTEPAVGFSKGADFSLSHITTANVTLIAKKKILTNNRISDQFDRILDIIFSIAYFSPLTSQLFVPYKEFTTNFVLM